MDQTRHPAHLLRLIAFLLLPFGLSGQNVQSFNLEPVGYLAYNPVTLAGSWHYVDSTGGEWALVGTSDGLSIVNLDNPAQPVEAFHVPGLASNWREVKTWAGFAYVGSEADSSGITIVDLRSLPDTVTWKVWLGDDQHPGFIRRSHTVQARDGYLYVFGGSASGAAICDLTDPWNPVIVGFYTQNYVHDGFIRNDTLWTSEIYQGQFGVVDVSDKSNPVLLATHPTPGSFNHNTALSDDGRYLFSTDEVSNTPLGSFDVSDLGDIQLLDTYYPSQKPDREVHNTYVFGDFLINPSYGGQLTIVDASRPDNLVETAWAVVGNSLVWDANPYLPSGIVFALAKNEGLFVFQPTYQHAAWLEGTVTDALSGQPIPGVQVTVSSLTDTMSTPTTGVYKTGTVNAGPYVVKFEKAGYIPKTVPNVVLENGEVTVLDVTLEIVVGTEELARAEGFEVFPSRFTDRIQVSLAPGSPFNQPGAVLHLLDVSGKTVRETTLTGPQTSMDGLDGLPAGAYWLRLQQGGKWSTARQLVKN